MDKERKSTLNVALLNATYLNSAILNSDMSSIVIKRPPGYGVDNWLWDDGQTMFWDDGGLVLTDK